MNSYDIIIKPVLSEKSYDGIPNKKYTFIVHRRANKIQIKQAVEEIFGVEVEWVNTMNIRGKFRRQRGTEGYTASAKKAIVQLKESSKKIEFFESLS